MAVTYNVYHGGSLGLHGVQSKGEFKKLQSVKEFLYLFSGCSHIEIDDYEGQENRWFGNYLVEVEQWQLRKQKQKKDTQTSPTNS